jgi:vesicle coat complex subunit
MQKTNEIESKENEKPCWFYIDGEPLNSFREVQTKMASKNFTDKEEALKLMLKSITNDENYPDNLMINVIHNFAIVEDIKIKKLLFLFWEVYNKLENNFLLGDRKS